jgi:hypothetical protein
LAKRTIAEQFCMEAGAKTGTDGGGGWLQKEETGGFVNDHS